MAISWEATSPSEAMTERRKQMSAWRPRYSELGIAWTPVDAPQPNAVRSVRFLTNDTSVNEVTTRAEKPRQTGPPGCGVFASARWKGQHSVSTAASYPVDLIGGGVRPPAWRSLEAAANSTA
jgi:hypothetical protein